MEPVEEQVQAPEPIPKDDSFIPPDVPKDDFLEKQDKTRRSSVASIAPPASTSLISGNLILASLELIAASKEVRSFPELKGALDISIDSLKKPLADGESSLNPYIIFTPLRLACESKSTGLMILALDSIGKLVSYDFFIDKNQVETEISLADMITTTVCECFSPSPTSTSSATTQHDTLLLRLLSSLLSLILSSALSVHQSSLLKAVRTVYNIFLMGSAGTVQTVAQATLGQIVGGVFSRISIEEAIGERNGHGSVVTSARESRVDLDTVKEDGENGENGLEDDEVTISGEEAQIVENGHSVETAAESEIEIAEGDPEQGPITPAKESIEEPITLESLENRKSFEATADDRTSFSPNDLFIKDAFLVFRALCKLSMKPLGAESERDLKSHAMRSKLLSLHLVLSILNNHLPLFINPSIQLTSSTSTEKTPFILAIKQYLCLSLSRNAVSPVLQVFELSCEIFSRVLSGMRSKLKREIEVLLNEIFLPILEMKNSTLRQKSLLLVVFERLVGDPQALVEVYLNYDCDRASLGNIYERLLNIISKLSTTNFPTPVEKTALDVSSAALNSPFPFIGPTLYGDSKFSDLTQSQESHLKRQSLECLVSVLRSLVAWSARGTIPTTTNGDGIVRTEIGEAGEEATSSEIDLHSSLMGTSSSITAISGGGVDEPSRFENAKQRKTTLLDGIKQFNFKPKRGIAFLIETGFIESREPKDIAKFLLGADGLSKAQIGEYLGEGEDDNIATMHAFVDLMDFSSTPFVDALRTFLQSFRLPGEAQKIDRYMLKFAEKFTFGNAGTFANADTAYILAFSVILLNTDAHNPQVKKPMTKLEFIKNNRGIDDGKDLEETLLSTIYDEINSNEIRMKDEIEAVAPVAPGGLANAIASAGRDLQREAYVWQSEGMANKTEALFRTMVRGQRRGGARSTEEFYSASHFEHVRPMLEVAWMPILAGISNPLQNSDDLDLIKLSLEGFKQSIRIVCLFDLELERNAFVTTLAKFTFLNNFGEMKAKNVEAIRTLLDIAMVDGNYLKGSWKEVLTCVSQLERFQLITNGVDAQRVPELGRKASVVDKRTSAKIRNSRPTDQVALETRSQHITITAEMIFSSTPQLSGTAIIEFVQALSEVSAEEIQASGTSEQPRVFALQKLVEISYYNMGRIRLEWSGIWAVLGEHFNLVTCHSNPRISFLALDSLRQLAMRFLEKEELSNFKFQKDFLKPFEFAMVHNNNPDVRDMVLQCLQQMLQARFKNLRSGWRTMFGVFSAASKVPNERIALQAFDLVQKVNKEHFQKIILYGSFADLTVCITDFSKITKFQRASLQAIEMLKAVIPLMLSCENCPLSSKLELAKTDGTSVDDPMIKFWFPVLFGFYDVIMNGEDLEVRKRALDYLFETLKKYGSTFPDDFWDTITKEVLFPIFAVLRSRSDVSRFSTHEDMSVWLSTTMIQALRNLVDLFTFYFDVLGRMLDKLLDLLCECICQENDTLARIGTSCLQQLLEDNVEKLSPARWERIVSTFVHLFKTTTAYQLFDENLRIPAPEDSPASPETNDSNLIAPAPLSQPDDENPTEEDGASSRTMFSDRKRIFRQIIVKCVLQLLLIETSNELLSNEKVYTTIPPAELLKLMGALDESYRFARSFNRDQNLRMSLWKVGFMVHLPNLLRQECSSAATLVSVLLRMYGDQSQDHVERRSEIVDVFAPLGLDILASYVSLNPETQARNIASWTPVVAEVLQGFAKFEDEPFKLSLPKLYPMIVNTLSKEMDSAVLIAVKLVIVRVGTTALGIEAEEE